MPRLTQTLMLIAFCFCRWQAICDARPQYEDAPINYSDATPHDAVVALIADLRENSVTLDRSSDRSTVLDLLRRLDIPVASQTVVFSKTSLQNSLISPEHPRSLFFSDDLYLGWVPGGSVEIIAHDPEIGPVFYLLDLDQQPIAPMRSGACLDCHGSSRTKDIPGMVVRSVFPAKSGQPILSNGSTLVDHSTPMDQRWGGWYVTGAHDDQDHLGNTLFKREADGSASILQQHGNMLLDLDATFDTSAYLTNTSDIVALMVLEHQVTVHNAISKARINTRLRLHQNKVIADLLKLKPGELTDTSRRVLEGLADDLLDAMLFYDELPLDPGALGKGGPYQAMFEQKYKSPSRGESLYTMDLSDRLFKYRFSYMIYSESFADLPAPLLDIYFSKLGDVFAGRTQATDKYVDISREERLAILRILQSTLPEDWLAAMGTTD